jgi:tetratricopeptide (TPR) repeat protein
LAIGLDILRLILNMNSSVSRAVVHRSRGVVLRPGLAIRVGLVLMLGGGAWQAPAHAQEPPAKATLAAGIGEARAGNFVNALIVLNDVVSQQGSRPEELATVARAHAYRAVAFIALEQPDWAREAAVLSLKADPRIVVDATEFGPRVVAVFEEARRAARDPGVAAQAAEAAGRFQDAFFLYLSAIQALPEPPRRADDQQLRERIIKLVRKLDPKPAVPQEAKTRVAGADGLEPGPAVDELRKAVRIAPWWPDAIVKLAVALQLVDRADEAAMNLALYRLATEPETAASGSRSPVDAGDRSAPVAAAPAAAAMAPAVIYVYFPHAARAMGTKSKVLCDGQKVADLAHEHYIVLNAAAGFHLIEFKGRKAEGSFESGKEHFIRVGIEGYPAHFALRLTDAATAAAEITDKQVLLNEAKNTFATECTSVAAVPRGRTSK